MKLVIFSCLIAAALAAPQNYYNQNQYNPNQYNQYNSDQYNQNQYSANQYSSNQYKYNSNDIQILRYDSDNDGVGTYRFAYEQSDGSKRDEQGELQKQGQEDEALHVTGSYTWVGPDGVEYVVKYTAGEEGFKPEIEQGPGGGVPPAVVASLLG